MSGYPAYRESRLNWVDGIPANWGEERAKFFFREVNVRSETGHEELLSVSHITGVTPRSEKNVTMFMAESYEGHKLCEPDDLVINSLWAWMGAVGISKYAGIVSSAYAVYRLKRPNLFVPKYLDYLLRTKGYAGEYLCRSNGIWTSRLQLTPTDFYQVPILRPPLEDQHAIVAYLDRKLAGVDDLIAKKQRLIALLREQRAAVINRAVTRGLDPTAPTKPSGIEWLGDIPAHWEVQRAKFLMIGIEQGWSPQCEARLKAEHEWGVLKVGCVNGSEFNELEHKALPSYLEPQPQYEIRPGDILISRANTRELAGSIALVDVVSPRLMLCDKLYRVGLRRRELDPRFFVYLLGAKPSREQIELGASGASDSMQNISQEVIKNLWVAVPSLEEQESIVAYIARETEHIATAAQRAGREIELLRELRAALIAEAVTGKIDVRAHITQDLSPSPSPTRGGEPDPVAARST